MTVVALIQARVGSKRLPGKVLLPIRRETRVIDAIVDAADASNLCDGTLICCPPSDAERFGLRYPFHAPDISEDDCAGRLLSAARFHEAKHFVRICADSPFIHPALIDLAVAEHLARGNKVTQLQGMPAGEQPQVYDVEHFAKAYPTMTPQQREHCIVAPMPRASVNHKIRLTIDTQEDYDRLKPLYESLPTPHWEMTWPELFKAVRYA